MIKKSAPSDELLTDIFHDDWAHGPMAMAAQRAATHARTRLRVRRSLAISSAAAVLLCVALHVRPLPRTSPVFARSAPPCEIISDAELLIELQDHPVLLLPVPDGGNEIVVLDL